MHIWIKEKREEKENIVIYWWKETNSKFKNVSDWQLRSKSKYLKNVVTVASDMTILILSKLEFKIHLRTRKLYAILNKI
jgi:hypothetical protein